MTHPFRVRGLGEVAIRCADLDAMVGFYRDVIGLEVLSDGRDETGVVFFKIAEGVAGHTCVLALFHYTAGRANLHPTATEPPETGAGSSLHHIALSLTRAEQEKAIAHYETIGQTHTLQMFGWIGWRGVFTTDPEGNTVELVAHDPAFLD